MRFANLKRTGSPCKKYTRSPLFFFSFWLANLYSGSYPESRQKFSLLTPRELEIALLIKEGRSSKEISEILSISKKAVQFHRQNLRKKLGIAGSQINLVTYLRNII